MRVQTYKVKKHTLEFKFLAGTSRGTLSNHHVKYLILQSNDRFGVGEIAPLPKLSVDFDVDFECVLSTIDFESCVFRSQEDIFDWVSELKLYNYPSLVFALEVALLDLLHGGSKKIFATDFYNLEERIPINGLIWMNTKEHMLEQVQSKIEQGYSCIKMFLILYSTGFSL